jgi:hypothetical protein
MEALFLGFASDTSKLRKAYSIEFFEPAGAEGVAKGLELRPKPRPEQPATPDREAVADEEQSHFFERARLFLREADYLPVRIRTDVDHESQVDLRIVDLKLNATDEPSILQVELPEGTKIIRNEELVETVGAGGKRIPETVVAPGAYMEEAEGDDADPQRDSEGS